MKKAFSDGIRLLPALLLFGLMGSGVGLAFDSPDFDADVFSADGIFLESSRKDSLLQALAALASNFPSHKRVDDDIREKALGIALRIDPLHYNSRKAYQALEEGRLPTPIQYFTNLTAASEALWSSANLLLEKPADPDEKKLAPFLMELSLLTHPDPPAERIEEFAAATGGKTPPWNRFVSLQPDEEASTIRAGDIMREVKSLSRRRPNETRLDPFSSTMPVADTPKSNLADVPEITPVKRQLMCIRQMGDDPQSTVTGDFVLSVRSPTNDLEREWFPFLAVSPPEEYPTVPLFGAESSLPLTNLKIPGSVISERNWQWPSGAIAELSCTPGETLQVSSPDVEISGKLPALILLDTALKEKRIHGQFVLAGEIDSPDAAPVLREDLLATTQAAARLERPYLLLPDSTYEAVLSYVQTTQNLGILFQTELIGYSSLDEAISFASNPLPKELQAASVSFKEIEGVDRMTLVDLARNSIVQKRLNAILAGYPKHLSARAMLAFGTGPEEASTKDNSQLPEIFEQIDTAIQPYLALKGSSFDHNLLKSNLEKTDEALSRMRMTVPLELRNFLSRSEDVLDAAEIYLRLTNKGTSTAEQRLRETRTAILELEKERQATAEVIASGN